MCGISRGAFEIRDKFITHMLIDMNFMQLLKFYELLDIKTRTSLPYSIHCSLWQACSMCLVAVAGDTVSSSTMSTYPDSKVHGANMGPIWGRQDPGGPHVGPLNLAIWVALVL